MKTLADLKRELDSMETTTPKMKSIDDTLQTLVSDMESFRLRSFSGGTKQMQIRCSSRLPQQVPYSTLESCHSVTATGNRVMLNELGNSDSLLPQIEMHVFDGTNPSMWLSKVERFFSIGRYTEEAKLDLVFLSLEGVALKWFLREKFRDWTSFEHRLLARFEPVQIHSSPEVFMPTKLIHVFAYETKSRYTTELIEEDESSALKKSNPEDNEANNSFDSKLKFGAYKVFDKMLIRSHNLQQRRKLRLSPKNRMFKFKNRNLQRNRPEKGKGKAGLGQSKKEWYSGWSCMTTLIQKGLVVKSSNPAKYMLTVESRNVADECIVRSGLLNLVDILSDDEMDPVQQANIPPNQNSTSSFTMREEQPYVDARSRGQSSIPAGPSSRAQACQVDLEGSCAKKFRSCNVGSTLNPCSSGSSHAMKACSSSLASDGTEGVTTITRLPPLRFGEAFEEAYDVILLLDDREQFATKGSRSIVDNIRSVFKIKIEVRRLPVGDCIWIARHKYQQDEYVLDFIVERKNVDDMRSSIMDNRYKDQKLRLQRSGIKKLIYILEGDPNQSSTAESIKTACFTTEILEGFDVLRTNGLGETLRKYGYLTKSIYQYYKSRVNGDQSKAATSCPSFDDFVKRCQDLGKRTISDVFAIQLMQIPQVTEEIAIAVLDKYKTLRSLASAYSKLDGNVSAQEEMLRNQSNNVICASASKNIYKLVWRE